MTNSSGGLADLFENLVERLGVHGGLALAAVLADPFESLADEVGRVAQDAQAFGRQGYRFLMEEVQGRHDLAAHQHGQADCTLDARGAGGLGPEAVLQVGQIGDAENIAVAPSAAA